MLLRYLALNVPLGDSPSERGSSDYDIRHTFSGAVSYDMPAPGGGIWKAIFGNWRNLFMKKLTLERVAPIISANVS